MAFLRCVVCVVSLFCLRHHVLARANSNNNKGFSLTVGKRLRCVDKKDSINITCELVTATKVNKASSWNILWRSDGKIIDQNYSIIHQNNASLISSLSIYVSWEGTKIFTCFAAFKERILSKQTVNLNASLTLSTKPQQTAINGARFIESDDEIKILEIYWKQSDLNDTYSLQYSIKDDDSGLGDKSYDQTECSYRLFDVYRVSNTTGRICKASIKGRSFPEYTEHRLSLVTTRGQCQSIGQIKRYDLQKYGKDPGPNKYDLLLIPHSVVNFVIRVARQRQVHVTWKTLPSFMDAFRRRYLLKYNCSEEKVNEKRLMEKTNITLHSADFPAYRPYAFCQFCIQACLPGSDAGVYSEPVCSKTRLHEETPSEPPKITCSGNECATIVGGLYRNVTVTWDLPPRETWNGNLTYLVVNCRARNGSKYLSFTERNLSRRFMVFPRLARRSSYDVEMAVCNKEGCSPFRNTVISREIESPTNQDVKQSNDSTTSFVTPIVSVVAVLLIVILVVSVKQIRKRRMERRGKLPKIHEPIDYDNICRERETEKGYDEIVSDEETEHGEDNIAQDNNTETNCCLASSSQRFDILDIRLPDL